LECGLKDKRDYLMVALLIDCALRRNELAEFEIETSSSERDDEFQPTSRAGARRICDNPTRILAGGDAE
jgi:hypothetical protein